MRIPAHLLMPGFKQKLEAYLGLTLDPGDPVDDFTDYWTVKHRGNLYTVPKAALGVDIMPLESMIFSEDGDLTEFLGQPVVSIEHSMEGLFTIETVNNWYTYSEDSKVYQTWKEKQPKKGQPLRFNDPPLPGQVMTSGPDGTVRWEYPGEVPEGIEIKYCSPAMAAMGRWTCSMDEAERSLKNLRDTAGLLLGESLQSTPFDRTTNPNPFKNMFKNFGSLVLSKIQGHLANFVVFFGIPAAGYGVWKGGEAVIELVSSLAAQLPG